MSISKKVSYDLTKIYFDGLLHLAFVRHEVVGFQSWKSIGAYSIEITFRDGATILTEYDDADKWKEVMLLIENDLTPNESGS